MKKCFILLQIFPSFLVLKFSVVSRLCDPIKADNNNDVANLLESLAGNFAGVVQYNKDNRAFREGSDVNITIDTLCDIMINESLGTPMIR